MPPQDPRPAKPGPRPRPTAGSRSAEIRPDQPAAPVVATPGKPREPTPGQVVATPGKPRETTPGGQVVATPGKPREATPGGHVVATPGKPRETTPGEPAAAPPSPSQPGKRTSSSGQRPPGATTQRPPARPPPPQPIGPGSVIEGRYRLEQALGSGGMSTVYRATHTRTGGKLAIKLLDPRLSSKADMQQRCIHEARAMMDIASNHVVRAYDVGTTPTGQVYIAMEYLEGEDLDHLLQREGPLPWPRVAAMALQICDGLSSAHHKNTYHRDIKPQNCFRITQDRNPDHIKLIDFGIAKDTTNEKELTQDGVLLGTPEYMAPELIAPNAVPDPRTDIYAVGATVYKLLTGTTPFASKNILDLLYHQKHSEPDPPSRRAPDRQIPPVADQLVLRALAKDPSQRFQSADEMSAALLAAFEGAALPSGRARTLPIAFAVERSGATPVATEPPNTTPSSTQAPVEAEASTLASSPAARDEMQVSQQIIHDPPRPITLKDVASRAGTLFSLALVFGLASYVAAPPPGELSAAEAPESPEVAAPLAPPDPAPETKALEPETKTLPPLQPPLEPPPPDSAEKPLEPPPTDTAPATPEPASDTAKPPEPVDAKPPEPAPTDSSAQPPPEPAPEGTAGPPPEPAPADTAGPAPTPPAGDPGLPQPDPDFGYRSAEKELRDQHRFMQTCLDDADQTKARLKFSIEVRKSGVPPHKIKVFSSNAAIRDCVKGLFKEFVFDSSPRGGAFAYTYQNGKGSLERLPIAAAPAPAPSN